MHIYWWKEVCLINDTDMRVDDVIMQRHYFALHYRRVLRKINTTHRACSHFHLRPHFQRCNYLHRHPTQIVKARRRCILTCNHQSIKIIMWKSKVTTMAKIINWMVVILIVCYIVLTVMTTILVQSALCEIQSSSKTVCPSRQAFNVRSRYNRHVRTVPLCINHHLYLVNAA